MFPPFGSDNPKVLILGSLAGRRSMAALEYYAHPQNAFWWIMQNILKQTSWRSYDHKLSCLVQHYILLWDVLNDAVRPGSLDSSIVAGSERLNPLRDLLMHSKQLELVIFNGQKAAALYKRYVGFESSNNAPHFVCLPSTSPAHAALSKYQKLAQWGATLNPILFANHV